MAEGVAVPLRPGVAPAPGVAPVEELHPDATTTATTAATSQALRPVDLRITLDDSLTRWTGGALPAV